MVIVAMFNIFFNGRERLSTFIAGKIISSVVQLSHYVKMFL